MGEAERRVVDDALRDAQLAGHVRDCGLAIAPSREMRAQRGLDIVRRRGLRLWRTRDHEDVLAAGLDLGDVCSRVAERAAPHLLVELGELANHHDATLVAERGGEVADRRGDAMRSLVQHDRARLRGEHGEPGGASRSLAGQEPLEHEAPGRHAAHDQRSDRR